KNTSEPGIRRVTAIRPAAIRTTLTLLTFSLAMKTNATRKIVSAASALIAPQPTSGGLVLRSHGAQQRRQGDRADQLLVAVDDGHERAAVAQHDGRQLQQRGVGASRDGLGLLV